MTPLGDGFQQIQDPCAAVSNFVETYNVTEFYQSWRIFQDPQTLDFKLHMFQFDGAPVAPQFLVSATPNMLPKRVLRNITLPQQTQDGFTTQNLLAQKGSAGRLGTPLGVILCTVVLGMVSLML
jgi:hypothetical protein